MYTFVPAGPPGLVFPAGPINLTVTASGPLVFEATQVGDYVAHTFRLFAGDDRVYSQPRVGELPSDFSSSISLAFGSDVASSVDFITVSNSYLPLNRTYNPQKPHQANVYPTTSTVAVIDRLGGSVKVTHARSIGVTALNGVVESILHRRLIDPRDTRGDDNTTIDHVLVTVIPPRNNSTGGSTATKGNDIRDMQTALGLANPLVVRVATVKDISAWRRSMQAGLGFITESLPGDVHLLDFKVLSMTSSPSSTSSSSSPLLRETQGLRLVRLVGYPGDPSVTVNLTTLFSTPLTDVVPTTPDYQRPANFTSAGTRLTRRFMESGEESTFPLDVEPSLRQGKTGGATATLAARGSIASCTFSFAHP